MQEVEETRVPSLGQEDPREKGMATHSGILAWRIPWTEEPGGLQSMGSQSKIALTEWPIVGHKQNEEVIHELTRNELWVQLRGKGNNGSRVYNNLRCVRKYNLLLVKHAEYLRKQKQTPNCRCLTFKIFILKHGH